MLDKARYIVVEGPIGAGKTSLAKRLAERLQCPTLLERPEDNPFLARFYQNMERWGLQTQLSFFFQRLALLADLAGSDLGGKRLIADFLLDKDPLFAELNLPPDELLLYREVFQRLRPELRAPDLVLYLQADSNVLIERVRRRNVEAEKRISESYIERVSARYADYFYQYDASPLFIVNVGVLNPVDDDADFELLLERVAAMRGYREFFGYAD